jgi:hypothetical protein
MFGHSKLPSKRPTLSQPGAQSTVLAITSSNSRTHYLTRSQKQPEMAATQKNVEAIERARTIKDVPWCEEYEMMISGMACVSNADAATVTNSQRY